MVNEELNIRNFIKKTTVFRLLVSIPSFVAAEFFGVILAKYAIFFHLVILNHIF
jgi:hypothetical protein